MSTSAFGVEHPISKADKYRDSYLQGINPRSKTKVKEGGGSALRRIGGPVVGNTVGQVAGAVPGVALAKPGLATAGSNVGGILGDSAMTTRNLKSKDTVSVNRRSKKKAAGRISSGGIGFNVY